MLAGMKKHSNILLNQGKLETQKDIFMLELISIERSDMLFSPVYGPDIAFRKRKYTPSPELKELYENVFLDKNNIIID